MKFKITIISTYEYEVDPDNYPKGAALHDMLAIDINSATEDPLMFFGNIEVTGEVIDLN